MMSRIDKSLLAEAKEFVENIAQKRMSDETDYQSAYISVATRLRLEADGIEQLDAMILRARRLLPMIERRLKEPKP